MDHPEATSADKKRAQEFLHDHPLGVLSTTGENGKPWGSAVYFVTDEDFNFFFVTREKTKKFQNIHANAHVALTVADGKTQTTVQAAGTITKVPSRDIVDVVFKKLASIRPQDDINWAPPVIKVHQGDWMVLKLSPNYAQFAEFKQQKTDIGESYIYRLV
jgi:general stress protein 26